MTAIEISSQRTSVCDWIEEPINFVRVTRLHSTFLQDLLHVRQRVEGTAEIGLPALEAVLIIRVVSTSTTKYITRSSSLAQG